MFSYGKMKNKKEIAKFLTWKNFIGTCWRLVLFCQLIIFLLINRKDCQKLLKIKYNKWIIKIKHLTVVSWDINWFIQITWNSFLITVQFAGSSLLIFFTFFTKSEMLKDCIGALKTSWRAWNIVLYCSCKKNIRILCVQCTYNICWFKRTVSFGDFEHCFYFLFYYFDYLFFFKISTF